MDAPELVPSRVLLYVTKSHRRNLSLWKSLVTIPCGVWTHCKCFYSSASVDHSSHVFTGGEVRFAEDRFGWSSIQSDIVA